MWVIFLWMRSQHKCINFYFPVIEGKFRKFYMYVLPRVGFTSRTFILLLWQKLQNGHHFFSAVKARCIALLNRTLQELLYWEVSSQFFSVTLEYLHCVTPKVIDNSDSAATIILCCPVINLCCVAVLCIFFPYWMKY